MGCYSGRITLEFQGTDKEKRMMEKLLHLMDPESDEDQWQLPMNEYFDDYPETALIGTLEKNEESEYYLTIGTIDPTLAPKLFAALFPASSFRYSIELEYSVSCDDTPYYTAVYEDHTLMIRVAYLYPTNMDEKIKSLCGSILGSDPDAEEKVKKYREEYGLKDDMENNWYDLLGELVDDRKEVVASLYEFRKELPSRDEEYEKSFFDGDDLLAYLAEEETDTEESECYIK